MYKIRFRNLTELVRISISNVYRVRCINSVSGTMESAPSKITLSERLSHLIRPVNYKLILEPDLKTGKTFKGSVTITVNVKDEKDFINLHTHLLNVSDVKVFKDNAEATEVLVTKFYEVPKLQQHMIHLGDKLTPGSYKIDIDYSGSLSGIVGFYGAHIDKTRLMVASKFQPTYARQAFPCFDEPDFKATYDITLVKPKNFVALSNMPEVSQSVNNETDTVAVSFATSVPMSTYLACFVICDFANKENQIDAKGVGKNFTLRAYGQKNQLHKIDFSLDIGKRATEFYINYYQVPFPLPKLDMIAIPDYISGATEHWGLITYRETSFLVDKAKASVQNQMSVANTVAHELAHMWFGNLVTVKWWDDLWLNEGFATYMQHKALNAIEPTWRMADQFLIKCMHSILGGDAKLSSRPIVKDVSTPDEITSIFDGISYNKGASVLRMLEGFIGEENFRNGITDYLKKFEFGNTVTRDLLASLQPYFEKNNPGLDLFYIMDTWTRQMGYPLVNVTKGEKNTYILTQKRFLIDPKAKYDNDSAFNYRWFIPLTYKTDKGTSEKILWLPDTQEEVKLTLDDDVQWLKINNNQVGYYRVNYPVEMWQTLIQRLNNMDERLTSADRAHLINEIFALAHAQVVPYDLAMSLTTYLKKEDDYVPWTAAASVFGSLYTKLMNTSAFDDFLLYVQGIIEPIYKKQNWEQRPSGIMERLIRSKILAMAVKYRLPEAQQKVRSMFLEWLNSPTTVTIDPDLRDIVYYYGMKSSSQEEWDKMWNIYMKEDDAAELSKIRSGLSAPQNSTIIANYLNLAWDERNVRAQDYLTVLQQISDNPYGTEIVWNEVTSRWPELVDRFTINSRYLGHTIPDVTSSFNTDAKLKEMETFFSKYPEAGAGEAGRKNALETVRNNIQWASAYQPVVAQWLAAQVKPRS